MASLKKKTVRTKKPTTKKKKTKTVASKKNEPMKNTTKKVAKTARKVAKTAKKPVKAVKAVQKPAKKTVKKTVKAGKKARRMTKALREKGRAIHEQLEALYPETPIPLDHSSPYTLLIAVLLSAQCKDARVNTITPHLYAKADSPEAMVALSIAEIEEVIRPCGLSNRKSKAIWNLSQMLIDEHEGQVPNTFAELEALPGVGHKTASVVMTQSFGLPAFPVDTHIHRLAKRWGLSDGRNVEQTEADLKALFPKKSWGKIHLQFIFFGREYCPARQHDPEVCPICSWANC